MLVLSRKIGQKIRIAGGIVITVVDVRSDDTVRLGIEAPREIWVHREEVLEQIEAAGEAAKGMGVVE